MTDHLGRLAGIKPLSKNFQDTAAHCDGIQRELRRELLEHVIGEVLHASVARRLSGHVPAFIIDAANEQRQLSAEMDGAQRRQPVP
jgi:hypothetical protein